MLREGRRATASAHGEPWYTGVGWIALGCNVLAYLAVLQPLLFWRMSQPDET